MAHQPAFFAQEQRCAPCKWRINQVAITAHPEGPSSCPRRSGWRCQEFKFGVAAVRQCGSKEYLSHEM